MFAGSYAYLLGTNIEVGILSVSGNPAQPYALCAIQTDRTIVQNIPISHLSKQSTFTKHGKLKKCFKHLCAPAKAETYIQGLSVKFQPKCVEKNIITYKNSFKAHLSALTPHPAPCNSAWAAAESLAGDATPAERGYIDGTEIAVHVLIVGPEISLFKFGNISRWLPNALVTTKKQPLQESNISGKFFLHGILPIEVKHSKCKYGVVSKHALQKKEAKHFCYLKTFRQNDKIRYQKNYARRVRTNRVLAIAKDLHALKSQMRAAQRPPTPQPAETAVHLP